MANDGRRDLPTGITPKLRTQGTERVPVTTPDGTPVYRVRLWDPVLKRQIERTAEGLDAAKQLLEEFNEAKRRPGRLQAEHARFADVAARYLVAYRVERDGTARPKSSLAKERTCLNVYILPSLGNAWIGDLDLPELNATIRHLTLQDGSPASGSTKGTVASVLRRLFAWAREERIIPVNPALELRTGWGGSVRRRVIIPSIPQVLRLAQALDLFKPGLGDVAMVLAFTGLRWEEAVAVPINNVSLDGQCMKIDRIASESGGRRDVREDRKTRAAERTVMIPDIAMPDDPQIKAPSPTDRRARSLVFLGLERCELVGRTRFELVTSSVSGTVDPWLGGSGHGLTCTLAAVTTALCVLTGLQLARQWLSKWLTDILGERGALPVETEPSRVSCRPSEDVLLSVTAPHPAMLT